MPKQIIIQAKTFTCNYSEREDRLLFTINYLDITQRVDFWITRSFFIKILPYIFEYSSEVASPQAENLKANISTGISKTDTSTFSLTQKEPILLDSVDFHTLDNGMKIVFKNTQKNIFAVGIFDITLLENMTSLLLNAVPTYEWGINI